MLGITCRETLTKADWLHSELERRIQGFLHAVATAHVLFHLSALARDAGARFSGHMGLSGRWTCSKFARLENLASFEGNMDGDSKVFLAQAESTNPSGHELADADQRLWV